MTDPTELTIKIGDLLHHKVLIGRTGAGKSTTVTELLSLRAGALSVTESVPERELQAKKSKG